MLSWFGLYSFASLFWWFLEKLPRERPIGPLVCVQQNTHNIHMQTWYMNIIKAWHCSKFSVPSRCLCLIFAVSLHNLNLCMIHEPNKFSQWQKLVFSSKFGAEHTCWSSFDISSPSHCCWARSSVANWVAWLAWMADRLLGRNEDLPHVHIWLINKVWSLPTFFALARRKAVLADGPFY